MDAIRVKRVEIWRELELELLVELRWKAGGKL
jgi:hypothetical protein